MPGLQSTWRCNLQIGYSLALNLKQSPSITPTRRNSSLLSVHSRVFTWSYPCRSSSHIPEHVTRNKVLIVPKRTNIASIRTAGSLSWIASLVMHSTFWSRIFLIQKATHPSCSKRPENDHRRGRSAKAVPVSDRCRLGGFGPMSGGVSGASAGLPCPRNVEPNGAGKCRHGHHGWPGVR
jgi:hypothetical protein